MRCPECGSHRIQVTGTRHPDTHSVVRFRRCAACKNNWRTCEVEVPRHITTRGSREQFIKGPLHIPVRLVDQCLAAFWSPKHADETLTSRLRMRAVLSVLAADDHICTRFTGSTANPEMPITRSTQQPNSTPDGYPECEHNRGPDPKAQEQGTD